MWHVGGFMYTSPPFSLLTLEDPAFVRSLHSFLAPRNALPIPRTLHHYVCRFGRNSSHPPSPARFLSLMHSTAPLTSPSLKRKAFASVSLFRFRTSLSTLEYFFQWGQELLEQQSQMTPSFFFCYLYTLHILKLCCSSPYDHIIDTRQWLIVQLMLISGS